MKYKVVYTTQTCVDVNHYNTIKEVKRYLNCIDDKYYPEVSVWDNELNDFIYFKFALSSKPETDLIFTNPKSDLRTKTRLKKED